MASSTSEAQIAEHLNTVETSPDWADVDEILDWYKRDVAWLLAEVARLQASEKRIADAAEMLWVVLANASGGDWAQQSDEWQEAAARWRDNYFAALKEPTA